MKKIFLAIIILLMNMQVFAGWRNAMLRLKHEHGRAISVTIDGRKYYRIGRTITIGDLPPGLHRIVVYKYNSNGYGFANGIRIYSGSLTLRPGRIYYGTVANDILDIEENCCLDNFGKWNHNDNLEMEDNEMSYREEPDPNGSNWNNNQQWNHDKDDHYADNDWDSYNGQMSDGRFEQLIVQVKKASFESAKVSVAKQSLKNNKITCKQLVGILNELSFESTKLDFSKEAYTKVIDKKNYFIINDIFTFQSSKDDLLEFLNKSN